MTSSATMNPATSPDSDAAPICETAGKAAGATDDYVHGSPWTAIGVAALAGVAVGYLLARR
jgi:ElaB/YqjD/DUF883 family membrane-anchored ribosome-binding protein